MSGTSTRNFGPGRAVAVALLTLVLFAALSSLGSGTALAQPVGSTTPVTTPTPCDCVTPIPPASVPQGYSWATGGISLLILFLVGVALGFALRRRRRRTPPGQSNAQSPPGGELAFGATGGGESFAAGAPGIVGE